MCQRPSCPSLGCCDSKNFVSFVRVDVIFLCKYAVYRFSENTSFSLHFQFSLRLVTMNGRVSSPSTSRALISDGIFVAPCVHACTPILVLVQSFERTAKHQKSTKLRLPACAVNYHMNIGHGHV